MGEVVPARTSPTLHPPSPPTVHQLSWLALRVLDIPTHVYTNKNDSNGYVQSPGGLATSRVALWLGYLRRQTPVQK